MTSDEIPHFELQRVYEDGTADEPEISPVLSVPADTMTDRRGALGFGLVLGGGVAASTMMGSTPSQAKKTGLINLKAHSDRVSRLVVSSDGKLLISRGKDNALKFWSMPDGKLLKVLKASGKVVTSTFTISPDNKTLVTSAYFGSTIYLWSLPQGKLLKKFNGYSTRFFAYSPDGRVLATTDFKAQVKLWSVADGKQLANIDAGSKGIARMVMSPDGKSIATYSTKEPYVTLWSVPDGKFIANLQGLTQNVNAIAFSPDSRTLAASSKSAILVWSLPEGKLLSQVEDKKKSIQSFFISPDGNFLVSKKHPKVIIFWSLPEAKRLGFINFSWRNILFTSISPDSKVLIGNDAYGEYVLWSIPDGKEIANFKTKRAKVSPNSRLLVTVEKNFTINVRSFPSGKTINELKGHTATITSMAISPDSKILVSGDQWGTIIVWDLQTGKQITALFDPAVNSAKQKAITFKQKDTVTGSVHTYTLPCGSPIPSGATCTCNCVAGTYQPSSSPKSHKRPGGQKYRRKTYCSCDKVCTCIPVCQAHKLLDQDPIVRSMAEQILLIMGPEEQDYMNWAANDADDKLKDAIFSLLKRLEKGESWNGANWPSVEACCDYLNHEDEVVSLMAAQMLSQWDVNDCSNLEAPTKQKMQSLLARAPSMHWKLRAS